MASKKYNLNDSVMLFILKKRFNQEFIANEKMATELNEALFKGKPFHFVRKSREIKDFFYQMKALISIHRFKNDNELFGFLEDTSSRTQKFIKKYEKADALKKIDIEIGLSQIHAIEKQVKICTPEKSFFRAFTEEQGEMQAPSSPAPNKTAAKKSRRTTTQNNMMASAF